jgi:hypothetical protein
MVENWKDLTFFVAANREENSEGIPRMWSATGIEMKTIVNIQAAIIVCVITNTVSIAL